MGPNGSGKSTLSYAIAGHPKYRVTSGSITLDGADVLDDEHRRAGARRTVSGHAVSRRGARRLGVELPAFGGDRHPRRGAQAAALGQRGQGRDGCAGDRPGLRRAQRQRGFLRRREEAPRDPAAGPAQAQDRHPRRDRLRVGRRRVAGGQRGREPLRRSRAWRHPVDHALHPDPALHPPAIRARVRRRAHRRIRRSGAGRRTRAERLRALHRKRRPQGPQTMRPRLRRLRWTSRRSAPTSRS